MCYLFRSLFNKILSLVAPVVSDGDLLAIAALEAEAHARECDQRARDAWRTAAMLKIKCTRLGVMHETVWFTDRERGEA